MSRNPANRLRPVVLWVVLRRLPFFYRLVVVVRCPREQTVKTAEEREINDWNNDAGDNEACNNQYPANSHLLTVTCRDTQHRPQLEGQSILTH